ncbi:glycosyltransferase family 2 protein [Pseudomonas putida]|uniref:Glycosyltransferase n=1 Tax=Pseudomonas putida TaxID=303 RepID=A0A7Z9ERU0_PSEPU|nr:glycosyltransferase family 2 protein [Pseudomonas putida]KAF0256756.1 glycosyltransferase [Pseudomonas putida]KWW13322.1 glycosyl transferase [Pseudomonas putida]MDF3874326.1 glycosyltransferase family 2 protein [Pseudomonas putida]MDF3878442.1 glycosyltransferase family 2 protein [Pseudomonas putida]
MDIFHRHRQANEPGPAAAALERALHTAEYRPEALVWKGIAALPQNPELAFVYFANAAQALPERADIHALVGRSLLAQNHFELATRYLTTAWQTQPNDLALRLTLWQARSQSERPAELRRIILAHLPDIHTGQELAHVLKLLAGLADTPTTVGVARYVPEQQVIQGWAIDLRNLQAPVALKLQANGIQADTSASAAHPLLSAAGLPGSHGGFRISVPNPTAAVHLYFADGTPLLGSPVFAMPAFAPPPPAGGGGQQQPVDVLIPVYNGLSETLECINSALDARKLNRTPHRLVVIDDASPVPALSKALKVLAAKGKITLVTNAVNLGFIRSMNRAMALSPNKDVVWLNADTRVHGAWLDRLRQVAYSDARIASVTPFTNNGELMSFPKTRISNAMPNARQLAELDELAQQTDSLPIEIETGCGFCLYIKRAALDEVGYLDEEHLARGYGEETDWCLRARGQGWHHMGAPNVFVAHQGGISFGAEKALRVAHNNAILRKRYPDASARYNAFTLRDPIKPARDALQRARLVKLASLPAAAREDYWPAQSIGDPLGAGLPAMTPEAQPASFESLQPFGTQTLHIHDGSFPEAAFNLAWRHEPHRTWATLQAALNPLPLRLDFAIPGELAQLLEALRLLPITDLAYEQLARCPIALCELPGQLGKPYRITCRDDRLLSRAGDYDWQRFAREATSVRLPWKALQYAYTSTHNEAKWLLTAATERAATVTDSPRMLLIGDALNNPVIFQRWLALARQVIREQLPLVLLAKDDTPWLKALQATGAVHRLPPLQGLSLAERALAAACDAVLSLDHAPGTDWQAPMLASELDVALFASPGPVATEAGAYALTSLPYSLSKA